MTIREIKKKFEDTDDIRSLMKLYSSDSRKGVSKILKAYEKKLREAERLNKIYEYENKYYGIGADYIAGIDEVGRGSLAGPVLTAAVILPKGLKINYVNDSKKLSRSRREELCEIITEKAVDISISMIDNKIIDEINILQATLEAMKKSIKNLKIQPDVILVDALTIPDIDIKQEKIIRGDSKSHSIAAASIVAKVTRDRIMAEYAKEYPEYAFDKNSGYGTRGHIEALKKYGASSIHRKSFLGKILSK